MTSRPRRVQVTVSGEALQVLDEIRSSTGMERDADVVREALHTLRESLRYSPVLRARCRPRGLRPHPAARRLREARRDTDAQNNPSK